MTIPIGRIALKGNERKYVAEAMESGWISSAGPFVERFETEFAAYVGAKHAVSCCNGTAALHLMLAGVGIGPGDEVIVPTLTFPATANAVRLCGAKVVLCDVDPRTWTLDPLLAALKFTQRTKATLGVSLYGHPTAMVDVLGKYPNGVTQLEDGAQAVGAAILDDSLGIEDPVYRPHLIRASRKIGSLAHATTFSFYGNKTLTCGEGGMVTTDDDELADKMRRLRSHGEDPKRKWWFPEIGYNYRMSNLHAAIGCAQLERIEEIVQARNRIAAGYIERLKPLLTSGRISCQPFGGLDVRHSWWLFSFVLAGCLPGGGAASTGFKRDELRGLLYQDGIETRPILTPLHLMPVYSEPMGTYPVAERIGLNGISLPTFEGLTEGEQDYICERIKFHLEGSI